MAEIAVAPESARPRRPSAGSARSRRRSPTATRRRPARSSPPTATGATSSPSRGTSRPWRGAEGVADLVEHTAGQTGAHGFRVTEPAAEADGVTEAWIAFETEVGRGSGHLRLQGGQGLDAAHHARRAQGPRGAPRAGPAARCRARRRARSRELARAARARGRGARGHHAALRRDHRRRAGRHRAGRAAAPARRPDHHRRPSPAARRPVAQPLQVALPARPGLVRPPSLHQVPRELARVLAEGQDRRLAGDVHAGDGAQLLGLDGGQERELGSRGAGVDRAGRARGPRGDAAPQAARLRHRHVEPAQPAPARGHGRLPGRAAPLVPAPRARRLSRQAGGRDRLQQLRARHLRRALGEPAST